MVERAPASIPAVLNDAQVFLVWNSLDELCEDHSIEDVSEALVHEPAYIRGVLRGTIRPSVFFAKELAYAIDVPLEDLLGLGGAS